MSLYQVTIEIESDTRVDRLREILDRIVLHTFGSSGTVENLVEVDDTLDPDPRTCDEQAIDDHYEAVSREAGARSYSPRTDGQKVVFDKPRISTGWETIRMRRYRGKSGVYYQSENDAAYAFDLEED